MKRWLLAGVMLASMVGSAGAFGPRDLMDIADASQNNEMRFNRDYKGQTFDGYMGFASVDAKAGWFGLGGRQVTLGGIFSGGVHCFVNDGMANQMVNWRGGQRVHVHGKIGYTVLGNVRLDDCIISEQ